MKKISTWSALLITVLFISGCASKQPEVTKAGDNTSLFNDTPLSAQDYFVIDKKITGKLYRISAQESASSSTPYKMRLHVEKEANAFCKEKIAEHKMLAIAEFTSTPSYNRENDPKLEILFVCIESSLEHTIYQNEKAKYQQVVDLKILLDGGTLTQAQFDIEKNKILEEYDPQEKISLQ